MAKEEVSRWDSIETFEATQEFYIESFMASRWDPIWDPISRWDPIETFKARQELYIKSYMAKEKWSARNYIESNLRAVFGEPVLAYTGGVPAGFGHLELTENEIRIAFKCEYGCINPNKANKNLSVKFWSNCNVFLVVDASKARGVLIPINNLGDGDVRPGPCAGMDPTRGISGGWSMLVGPDDPIWAGEGIGGDQSGFSGGFGGGIRGGQPGFPGALGVPPGARFDPYGPPGVPGFEPNHFTRFLRRPGCDTHPDLEQPGRDDFI